MTYIFVVYNYLSGLIENLDALYAVGGTPKVIIIDNSHLVEADAIAQTVQVRYPQAVYVRSTVNNRLEAYNIGFSMADTEWVCFRTDDDSFDEALIASLPNRFPKSDVISGCHSYNNKEMECRGPNRPFESFIFRTKTLAHYFPIQPEPASDWKVLSKLYDDEFIEISHTFQKIFDKKPHGRPA